jgi:3-oxoacyl-[acyl-carrier protein] reductase
MDLRLKGKRALVTGSSAGIGRAIATTLAAEGVAVVVHGRDRARADETTQSIKNAGGTASVAVGDLGTDDGAASIASAALAALGTVDILITSAGGSPQRDGWRSAKPADWIESFNLNVVSAVRLIEALAPRMREQRFGRIILIGSTGGANPPPSMAAYSAAKGALVNVAVSLAKDLADTGITANVVSPGPTLTENWRAFALKFAKAHGLEGNDFEKARDAVISGPLKNPSNRAAEPEEVAALVALLASPLSASINGANLRIDGGFAPTVN